MNKLNIDLDVDKNLEFDDMKRKNINIKGLALGEFFNGSIHAPLSEELFFRFMLYKMVFVKILKIDPITANVLQATIFGSLHLSNSIYSDQNISLSIMQSISSGITGLLCGYSYYYTNSLFPAILSHVINNLMASYSQISSYNNYLKDVKRE